MCCCDSITFTAPLPPMFRATAHRQATVKAVSTLVVLTLDRNTFIGIIGPLQDFMAKEKSAEVGDMLHRRTSTSHILPACGYRFIKQTAQHAS